MAALKSRTKTVFSKRTIYRSCILTLLVLASYFIGREFSALLGVDDGRTGGIWCAISAIIVFDDSKEGVRKLARTRALGTLLGAVIGLLSMLIFNELRWAVAVALVTASLLVNLFRIEGALKIACTALLVVCMSTDGRPSDEMLTIALGRFATTLLGGVLAMIATAILSKWVDAKQKMATSHSQ